MDPYVSRLVSPVTVEMNTEIKLPEHQKPDEKKTTGQREKWRPEMRDKPVKHKRKTDRDLLDMRVWRI